MDTLDGTGTCMGVKFKANRWNKDGGWLMLLKDWE